MLYALNARGWLGRGSVNIKCRQFAFPVTLRVGNSSDIDVFQQVAIYSEYAFLADLSDVKVAVDLGANIGLASALILSTFPGACIVALEPEPGNCERAKHNLRFYGDRARVIEGAIWSQEGEVGLDDSFGDSREWAMAVKSGHGIRAYSMKEILSSLRGAPIDLLKIDIEGSEIELFSGDVSWLDCVRNLCIELHGPKCETAFRSAMAGYRWREWACGEYTVCQGIERN
jgi:FkbM family methyltransferase